MREKGPTLGPIARRLRLSSLRLCLWLVVALLGACDSADGTVVVPHWVLSTSDPETTTEIDLPRRLDDLVAPDTTYRLVTFENLPERLRGRPLTLAIPRFEGLAELSVDGEPAVSERIDIHERYRRTSPHVWRVPASATIDGVVELELVVEPRWTMSRWWLTTPLLYPASEPPGVVAFLLFFNDTVEITGFFGLALLSMVYLWVFLFDRVRNSYYLFFAIQAGTACYYPLFAGGLTQPLLGHWDLPVLASTLAIAMVVSLYFTHAHFGLGPPSRWWSVALAAVLLVTLVFATPGRYTGLPRVAPCVVALLAAVVVYTIAIVGVLMRKRPIPRGSIIFVTAWGILGLSAVNDGAAYLGLGEPLGGIRSAGFGLMSFAVLQSLLVGREHIASLRLLNVKLANRVDALQARQREVQQLNAELRRQIADRSRQMFTALSLIGAERLVVPDLEPGEIVQSRYRVLGKAGVGGMGMVYVVRREADGQRFALKVASRLDAEGLARFAREAEIAARVRHPNLVEIVDVDVAEAGFFFLVMELVDGPSLADLDERYGDIPWGLSILEQIARGLVALHEVGIVHRDVKPTNVLMVRSPDREAVRAKLADYGVSSARPVIEPRPDDGLKSRGILYLATPPPDETASSAPSLPEDPDLREPTEPGKRGERTALERRRDLETPRSVHEHQTVRVELTPNSSRELRRTSHGGLTRADELVGTPMYMAPELGRSADFVQPKSDMFSFGVLAHLVLTGSLPYDEPPVLALVRGRRLPTFVTLKERTPTLDPEVARLLDSCVAIAPEDRPDAATVAATLAKVLERDSVEVTPEASRPTPLSTVDYG